MVQGNEINGAHRSSETQHKAEQACAAEKERERQRQQWLLSSPLVQYGRALREALSEAKFIPQVSRLLGASEPVLVIFEWDHFVLYSEDRSCEGYPEAAGTPAPHRLDMQMKLRTEGPDAEKVALQMRIYQAGEGYRYKRRLVRTCGDSVIFLTQGITEIFLKSPVEASADDKVTAAPRQPR